MTYFYQVARRASGPGGPAASLVPPLLRSVAGRHRLAFCARRSQARPMPTSIRVLVGLAILGGLALVWKQVRDLLRQRRNLKHWERDEPLEHTDGWD